MKVRKTRGYHARHYAKESPSLKDADIDTLSADGAQENTRWADAVAAVAEAIRHLESAQQKTALVGEADVSAARTNWILLVSASAD
jgi:hypothetical protein